MYQCPTCPEPFVGAEKLKCDHVVCKKCIDKNTEKFKDAVQINCPFEKCHQTTLLSQKQPLKPLDKTKYQAVVRKHHKKAMEVDLLETYNEMDRQEKEEAAKKKALSEQAVESSGQEKANTERGTGWSAMGVMIRLASIARKCAAIEGFSESEDGNKVEIDVSTGQRSTVEHFLKENFPDDFAAERLDIIEQEGTGDFLVGIGTTVASGEDDVVRGMTGKPIESLRIEGHPYGTVTCLAEAKDAQNEDSIFILTSHHVINQNEARRQMGGDANSGCGVFVSSYHNNIEEVSDFYWGIQGPVDFNGISYNVDIAALKLRPDVQSKLKSHSCSCRLQDLMNTYTGDDNSLKGTPVQKNGAATGVTCGKIARPYFLKYHPEKDPGMGFLVLSQDEQQPFTSTGDSGSLVWSTDGQPIGIVSYHRQKFKVGRRMEDATFIVRLDRCIEALGKRRYIQDVKCKTHSTPVPVVRYQEQPNLMVDNVDVQSQSSM